MNKMKLFTPGKIGSIETKNRIFMAPMVRNYAEPDGVVNDKYIAHWTRIARGGVGCMTLEASFVSPEGRGFARQIGIHDDGTIKGLQKLTAESHKQGAIAGVQLHHAGRQTSENITGESPVAPSSIKDPVMGETPRTLESEEIPKIIEAYAVAAERARAAEFDYIEVHAAHGYLITQFLSPFSNTRDDDYGGSFDNRFRFLLKTIDAIRQKAGEDFPMIVRLSGEELVEGGLTMEDTLEIAGRLEDLAVDALHISAGNYASFPQGYMIQPMAIQDGPLVRMAARVKEAVSIPVIAVGKIRSPELAEKVLNSEKADFIALGRPLLTDPDWPLKAMENRDTEINRCIACNQGCISRLFVQDDVWCTINPEVSREQRFERKTAPEKKKVLVAGGGPGGMQAAITAAEQGHEVVLLEKQNRLGGQLHAAAAAPHRIGWEELLQYMIQKIHRLEIEVRLNSEATVEVVKSENPDAVIVATGSTASSPPIEGISNKNVVQGRDILVGQASVKGKVIVAGGGATGAQVAEFLKDKGHPVTIVEMVEEIAADAAQSDGYLLIKRLEEKGVEFRIRTRIMEIREKSILVESDKGEEELKADTVVLCLGSQPDNSLGDALKDKVPRLVVVGDALEARQVTEAMAEGALAVMEL